jgi:hypothetical protein
MSDQLLAEILASLIKGFPRTTTTTTTKQNVDPAVHFVYSRVKINCLGINVNAKIRGFRNIRNTASAG